MVAFTPTGYITLREAVTRCAEVLRPNLNIRKYLEWAPRPQGEQTLLGAATQVHPKWYALFESADPFCFAAGVGCASAVQPSNWAEKSGIQVPEFQEVEPCPPEWLAIESADREMIQALGDGRLEAATMKDGKVNPVSIVCWQRHDRPARDRYGSLFVADKQARSLIGKLGSGDGAKPRPAPAAVLNAAWDRYVVEQGGAPGPGREQNLDDLRRRLPGYVVTEGDIRALRRDRTPPIWGNPGSRGGRRRP